MRTVPYDHQDAVYGSYEVWKDTPLVSELFQGRTSARIRLLKPNLRSPGLLGDVKAALERRSTERTAMQVLKTLFVDRWSGIEADKVRVLAARTDRGISVLLLPPSGHVVQIFSERVDGILGYCAGYLSPGGWMWTDLLRLEHLGAASTGRASFVKAVMG